MKKQTSNTLSNRARKTALRLALASTLLGCNFLPAGAQQYARPGEPVQIKYIGAVDSQPLFQMDLDNESGETYFLSIKGEDGTLLYTEKLKERKISRKFRWNNTDTENTKLTFTLTGERSKSTQAFEVNTRQREVQDVVITKL